MNKFTSFVVAGTGINYETILALMSTGVMKERLITNHEVISDILPLNGEAVAKYSEIMLQDFGYDRNVIDNFMDTVKSFTLCHGRARFISSIVDSFRVKNDIDHAIAEFISRLSHVDGYSFPLKYLQRDLERGILSFNRRVLVGDTLGRIVRKGMIDYMMTGKAILMVREQTASDTIRYGLGFCRIDQGIIYQVEIVEDAIIQCLGYLIPLTDLVPDLAEQLLSYPKPQMVGLMLEYLVAYAFVANKHNDFMNHIKSFAGSIVEFLYSNEPFDVFFPDHCCGPDIMIKHATTLYIIQVKFQSVMTKQDRVKACHTTDPEYFYWNRNGNCVLKGFEGTRDKVKDAIREFTIHRYVFLHTLTQATSGIGPNVTVINESEDPHFFDKLDTRMWKMLNEIRADFTTK
ncbi:hypothetical protein HDU76_000709 [Blyttiomyces sp. JEL0837]|nr:hypothetical protein HDU76_000709 [Blyttiomyces sp. JEL0837]